MVPQAEGEALIRVMTDEPAQQGLLVPMNCKKSSGIGDKNQHCHPAAKSERSLVENIARVREEQFIEMETQLVFRNSARPGGCRPEVFEFLGCLSCVRR